MDLNGVYASLNFPSSLAGFAGQRYQLGVSDPELALAVVRAANDWHLEEWAGTYPGSHHPVPGAVAARPRASRADGDPPQRGPRLPGGDLPRAARAARPAVAAHRLLGPVHGGVRGDRHGRLPARRVVVERADDVVRRAVRHHRRAVLRLGDVRRRRLAVLEASRCASPNSRSACPRAASAGWPGCSTASTTSALPADVRHVGRHRPHARARCCSATSGSARSRTRAGLEQRHRIGIDHICSSPTIRTRTAPGPTPRRSSHDQIGDVPGRRRAQAHLGERARSCSTSRCPRPSRTIPRRTDRDGHVDLTTSAFRIAAGAADPLPRGLRLQRRRPRQRARDDEDDAFWVTGFEYFDQTTPDARRQARLRPRSRARASWRSRPRSTSTPASTDASRRERDRPPALALHLGALVDRGSHDRHVQRRLRCCSTTSRRPTSTTATSRTSRWSTRSATSASCS